MSSPLILVDGSSYFFRAFHALPPLTNSKGLPTGAIYGVANMIKKLIKDYQPEHIAIIFDAKGKTFRDDLYPQYKAHRPATPPDLSCQFEPLIKLLEVMGLPLLTIDGVEADDVIGTLTKMATDRGQEVIISTSDKDIAQLVNEKVKLINTMTNTTLDIPGVQEKFGVHPNQIIDYLTLVGDTVDNIPGVTKCGPKTAAKWLHEFKTLDNLIANAHTITGKIGEYLRESIPFLPLGKQLVTIKTDVELSPELLDLQTKPPHKEKLLDLVRDLEFKHWIKELHEQPLALGGVTIPSPITYKLINDKTQLHDFLNTFNQCKRFCINTYTNTSEPNCAEIIGLGLALENQAPVYIPFKHHDDLFQLPRNEVLEAFKPILENPQIQKIGYNLKNTYHHFKNYGITLKGLDFDIVLESYLLNSNATNHSIDSLSLKYLGKKIKHLDEVIGKGVKIIPFSETSINTAAPYATEETETTLLIHKNLYPTLDKSLLSVFETIEMPLVTVLAEIERKGVLIDVKVLAKQGERLKVRMIELEKEAVELAGKPFNLNSPKQLQTILFEELNLPVISKTPTGQASTSEAILQELALDYRLPAVILEYRSLTKLVSTYIDALPKKLNVQTHRVHTSYNQAVAATGRLSSSEPNLQNIPIRSEEGRLIRTAFIAPPGHILLAADYSQIELRIMAHLSQDPGLLEAFAKGLDIHTATASEIFQVPLDSVSSEQRRRSKAINFGLIYGMSAFGLSKQIGVDRKDAQFYMDSYFKRYPGVLDYMEKTRQLAHEQGYVETLFGRRLYLPEINTKNMARQKAAERAAINAPMQGSAADIIKKSMLALSDWQNGQDDPKATMIMQVHDELVFEVKQEAIEECKNTIQALMENSVKLSVPLEVSIGTGLNWDEAH